MKKIISFSLWGDDPKYTVGAIRNAELAEKIYPGWTCRFYVATSVPSGVVEQLKNFKNTEIVLKNSLGDWTSMYWRFAPAGESDVDIMISRDTDSRLGLREKTAVDEWERSDKGFHIMRDHPAHGFYVLGGMWGAKKGTVPNMKELMNSFSQSDSYGTDYDFFNQSVRKYIEGNVLVHDEFFDNNPFPSQREGLDFVGKVFDEREETVREHEEHLSRTLLSKSPVYILPHLGLGDHIICNAIVNIVSEQKKVIMYCKHHNTSNVKRMHPGIDLVAVNDDADAVSKINEVFKNQAVTFLGLGNFGPNFMENSFTFDHSFYMQSGIPYNDRWNKFSFLRDEDKEEIVMKTRPKGKFLFVHDDTTRGLDIKKEFLPHGFELYRPNHNLGDSSEVTIFDYIPLIEQSEEIHCMDSSFAAMIDHIDSLRHKKKYIHRYIRKESLNPFYKNNWEIIE